MISHEDISWNQIKLLKINSLELTPRPEPENCHTQPKSTHDDEFLLYMEHTCILKQHWLTVRLLQDEKCRVRLGYQPLHERTILET